MCAILGNFFIGKKKSFKITIAENNRTGVVVVVVVGCQKQSVATLKAIKID